MSIRLKILSGFIILVVLLSVAGGLSIYELSQMGSSVQKFLNENYRSIQYSNEMNNALERENRAVLLLLNGNWEQGRQELKEADNEFIENLELAENNITVETEVDYMKKIRMNYTEFKNQWVRPIVDTPRQGNLQWYYDNIFAKFYKLREDIKKLIAVNDKAIYETSRDMKAKSNRAIMPGIIAVIASLLFTFLFVYFVNYYFVSPIINMRNKVKNYIEKRKPFEKEVESSDEISELEDSIRLLCEINQSMEQ